MSTATFLDDLAEMESAEDFLDYFGIQFEPAVVHVNRLHILQRFHDYLEKAQETLPAEEESKKQAYATLLQQAYRDFVESNPLTEKVFKVFRHDEGSEVFIPLDQAFK